MKDLLTNIKEAIKLLNEVKKLNISLTDPNAVIDDRLPVGVSMAEWEESLKMAVEDTLFTADDICINFDCSFNYTDLLIPESDAMAYTEAMQRIAKEIFERYKWAKSIGQASICIPSINSSRIYSNNGGWSSFSNTIQSTSSNIQVASDLNVNGEINADDIKINGGQLSVSSELDDLKYKNQVLEAELNALKAMLENKGGI